MAWVQSGQHERKAGRGTGLLEARTLSGGQVRAAVPQLPAAPRSQGPFRMMDSDPSRQPCDTGSTSCRIPGMARITEPLYSMAPRRSSTGGAWLFVWGTWLLLLVARLSLTGKYGNPNIPLSDEWFLLDTAPKSVSLTWLWEQWAEHRVPLAKLLWLGVLRLTEYDFRAGSFVAIVAWAVMASAMILTAKVLRGHTSYADAFFPLALLNFGQGLNFFWWWTVNQMVAPFVACTVLLIIVLPGRDLQPRFALATAILLVLLPLCGPSGLPYVATLAVWLAHWTYLRWSSSEGRERRISLLVLGLTVLAVTLVGCYFKGLNLDTGWPSPEPPHGVWKTVIQLLSLSLGTAARDFWRVLGIGVLALTVVCMAVLSVVWVKRPEERCRALGLFLFIGAASSLPLVIARVRSGMSEDYIFSGTYVPLLVPILCWAYFLSDMYIRPILGPIVAVSLLTVACVLLLGNVNNGVNAGRWMSTRSHAMEDEIRAGIPGFILAERHLVPEMFHVFSEDRVVDEGSQLLGRLQRAGIGVFARMRPDPEVREVNLNATPSTTNRMTWKNGAGYGHAGGSGAPYVAFSLGRTQFVYAVRLRFSYANTAAGSVMFEMSWGPRGRNDVDDAGSSSKDRHFDLKLPVDPARTLLKMVDGKARYESPGADNVLTIWVNDRLDQFRIYPDTKPCVFRLSGMVLLVPRNREAAEFGT